MIPYLSEKIASSFIEFEIIKKEDQEVYSYSFEILISTLLNFLVICFFAIFTKTIVETIFYLIAFIPLRQLVGGYHAKNHFRCFTILLMAYAGFLMVIYLCPVEIISITILIIILISYVLVFSLAPVADSNKPITNDESYSFKYKSRIAISTYSLITILMMIIGIHSKWILALSLGIISIALSLVAGTIKNKMKYQCLS